MQEESRRFVVFGIRIDVRIAERLKLIAREDDRKRNWLIEQILAEKCGISLDPNIGMDDGNDGNRHD